MDAGVLNGGVTTPAPSQSPAYRERLWPTPGVYVACLLLIPAGLFVFLPIDMTIGIVAAAILFLGGIGFFVLTTRTIEVNDRAFVAGRASLPREFVGEAVGYDGLGATFERGPGLDARAYTMFRGGVKAVVRVENTDPNDPTPYWLVSTRRPEELVAALATP